MLAGLVCLCVVCFGLFCLGVFGLLVIPVVSVSLCLFARFQSLLYVCLLLFGFGLGGTCCSCAQL